MTCDKTPYLPSRPEHSEKDEDCLDDHVDLSDALGEHFLVCTGMVRSVMVLQCKATVEVLSHESYALRGRCKPQYSFLYSDQKVIQNAIENHAPGNTASMSAMGMSWKYL